MADIERLALDLEAFGHFAGLLVFAIQGRGEAALDGFERDAAFGALGTGQRRHDGAEVELQRIGEERIGAAGLAEQALRLRIGLDQREAAGFAAGNLEVVHRLVVDGEEAAGGAVLGRHVGDRGAVGERHVVEAGAEEFDELVDDALLAQHLRDGQHDVGRGDAFLRLARQLEADHLGNQHRLRLAEHGGFRLDAADAPAEHGQTIDHRRVAVGADDRVGIGEGLGADLVGPDRLGEIFEIDLMADAGAGRHDAEVREGALAPLQEVVALAVALVFEVDVLLQDAAVPNSSTMTEWSMTRSTGTSGLILRGSPPSKRHAVAHGGEIDDGGHAREILHQHACRPEADLGLWICPWCRARRPSPRCRPS